MNESIGEMDTKNGMSFIDAKCYLNLQYTILQMTYIHLKLSGVDVSQHKIISKLNHVHKLLTKIRPIDRKLQF